MKELLHNLAVHRRRIRGARVADEALRWGFYASVAGCVAMLISKVFGIGLPGALAAAVLVGIPLAAAAREWTRSFSLHDCAVHLDRLLGLDERLSTALEEPGLLAPLIVSDASGALARSALPPRRIPREGKLLGASLVLLAVLGSIPAPERTGARGDPAIESLSAREAAALESLANVDVQFQEITLEAARELRRGDPEQALILLEDLRRKLTEKLLEGTGGGAPASQRLLDQASSSAQAVSAELARLGRRVHAPPPVVAQAKLRRQRAAETGGPPESSLSGSWGTGRTALAEHVPWDARYDSVIQKYFEGEP